ncbi:MAG: hypothetical protein LAP61_24960 [Acidobacteriia bacterium]|nr:hypothetical protein [Terriglobia bacterium]
MKRWAPEHVRLAATAVKVRDELREVDWARLDSQSARIIASCVRSLTAGLKARTYRPRAVETTTRAK